MPKRSLAYSAALKQLETSQPVLISGIAGSGKTHLALDLMVTLLDGADEYDPLILENPNDLRLLHNTPSPAIVLVDQYLGDLGVCRKYLHVFRKHKTMLNRLIKRRRLLVILTAEHSRVAALSACDMSLLKELQCHLIDLSSEDYAVESHEEHRMLLSWHKRFKKQLFQKDLEKLSRALNRTDDVGFPAFCQLSGLEDCLLFNKESLNVLNDYFTQLEQQFNHCYILLVLLVACSGKNFQTQTSSIDASFEHFQNVTELTMDGHYSVQNSLDHLKNVGLIEETIKGNIAVPSRLVRTAILRKFLRDFGEKCIPVLSLSAISLLKFRESASKSHTLFVPCEISSTFIRSIATNIHTALETKTPDMYMDIAGLELWENEMFLETIHYMYGYHIYFIGDSAQTSLLSFLIRTNQRIAVMYLLEKLKDNSKSLPGVLPQINLAKEEAAICDDKDILGKLLKLSHEVTHKTLLNVVQCNDFKLLLEITGSLNSGTICSSDPSLLQHACSSGSLEVLQFLVKKIHSKILASEIRKKDSNGMTLLHRAALFGDLEVYRYLETLGADPNCKTTGGLTVAHICSIYGHVDLLNYIHQTNKDIASKKAKHGLMASHFAAMEGNTDVLEFLIGAGVDMSVTTDGGNTVSHVAAANGRQGILRLIMLKSKGQMDQPNCATFVPPQLAAKYGQTETLRFFFKYGIDPEIRTIDKRTLVHLAAYGGHLETVEFFCSSYPRICKLTDMDGNTVLHDAAAGGDVNVFVRLIESGVNALQQNNDGATVLHDASYYGRFKVVQLVCSKYPDLINGVSRSGLTPALGSALGGHIDIFDYLEKQGSNMKVLTCEGSTALHEAAYAGQLPMVKYLCLRFPYMQEMRNERSFLPYHFAAQEGHLEILKFLLPEKLDQLKTTNEEQTILHLAAYNGMINVVKFICLKIPVLLPCKDTDGATALHYAARGGSIEALEYLIEKGLDPRAVTGSGSTILHLAAFDGNLDMVKYICDKFPDIAGHLDTSGHNAAHYAAGSGEVEVLLCILQYGVSPMIRAENGSSLLMKAAGGGKMAMVKYLCTEYPDMVSLKDKLGCDMLHYAACGGDVGILGYGIEAGIHPMTQSFEQHSVLHVATFHRNFDAVRFLCESFPEMRFVVDASQKTAEDIAKEMGYSEIMLYFKGLDNGPSSNVKVVGHTKGLLSEVLCCVGNVRCPRCKNFCGALSRLLCFCRK